MRCSRNAIIWSGYYDRRNWFPNKHTIIRNNLIEQVPGDGIVPIGCDSTLIEYNVMFDSPDILPMTEQLLEYGHGVAIILSYSLMKSVVIRLHGMRKVLIRIIIVAIR